MIDNNNETTEVEEIDNEEELDGDADTENVVNLTDNLVEILSLFNEEDEASSAHKDKLSITDMSVEVSNMKHDDGAEYREKNPFPTSNDTSFKQDKLKGTRNQKITLSTLFTSKIKLPPPNEEYNMTF